MKFRRAQIGSYRKTLAQLTLGLEALDQRFKAKPLPFDNPKAPEPSTAAETAMKVVMAMKSSAAIGRGRAQTRVGNAKSSSESEPNDGPLSEAPYR